jgi:acyl carrier protein
MEERVRQILEKHSGLGATVWTIPVTANLWSLGMTSLASVDVMLALEKAFAFEFPESRLRHATFSSVDAIVECVGELTGSRPS